MDLLKKLLLYPKKIIFLHPIQKMLIPQNDTLSLFLFRKPLMYLRIVP